MSEAKLCFLLILAVSVALVIYGFAMVLKKQEAHEQEVDVVPRQLRGFGYLILAQLVLVLGAALCVGLNTDLLSRAVKSVRL